MKVIKGHTLIEMDWKEKDGKDGYQDAKGRRRGRDKEGDVIKDMEMEVDVKGDEEEGDRDELQVRFVTR